MATNNTFLYNTDYNKLTNNEKKKYQEIKIYIKISKNEDISKITYKTEEEYNNLNNKNIKNNYQEVIFYLNYKNLITQNLIKEKFITQNLIKEKFIKHDTPTINVNNKGQVKKITFNKKYTIHQKKVKIKNNDTPDTSYTFNAFSSNS